MIARAFHRSLIGRAIGKLRRLFGADRELARLDGELAALRQSCELMRQSYEPLRQAHELLRQAHDDAVAWLRSTYPEIVSAVAGKVDEGRYDREREENRMAIQDILAVIHSEIGRLEQRRHSPSPVLAVGAATDRAAEDYRMARFYLDFERGFRGTTEQVTAKLRPHLDVLRGIDRPGMRVIDLGCGRGEWLRLLKEAGFAATGVDLNPINGDYCRTQGFDAHVGDAIEYLANLPAASVGAVTAFHLIEHLPFSTQLALADEILRVLEPGGLLIYETPNPENLLVATRTFWHDPTHLRPLPPELIQFLVTQRGFVDATIRRLHPVEAAMVRGTRLDELLDGPRDYAVVARKPHSTPSSA